MQDRAISYLTPEEILQHLRCPRSLWLQVFRSEATDKECTEVRSDSSCDLQEVARRGLLNSIVITGVNHYDSLELTSNALEMKGSSIFGGEFLSSGVLAKTDILIPERGGYRLTIIAPSESSRPDYIEDLAIQYWVLRESGNVPVRCTALKINNDFIYRGNDDYQDLLVEHEVTTNDFLQSIVPRWISNTKATLQLEDEPSVIPGEQCIYPTDCPFLRHCVPLNNANAYPDKVVAQCKILESKLDTNEYQHSVLTLDLLAKPKYIRALLAVSSFANLKDDAEMAEAFGHHPYPRYHLQIEATRFVVPKWEGTRPYQWIPSRWLCHIEQQDGAVSVEEFLGTPGEDPRRKFAESLIDKLGSDGPVLAIYSKFEKERIYDLASEFPEYWTKLWAIIYRLTDITPTIRNLIHSNFPT